MRSTSGSPQSRPGSAHRKTIRGWNGRCKTSAATSGPGSTLPTWPTPRTGWRSGAGRLPGYGCTAPPRRGRPKCSPTGGWLSATAAKALRPAGLHPVKVHRDYHGEVARALSSVLSICSARAWTPASTASAGPFLVFAPSSRQKEGDGQQNPGQVSETAMRLHCAHPEVVLGGVEAGRVDVPIQPLAAPPPTSSPRGCWQ